MSVDYDGFAKSFSESRKNMKWPEIEYFFSKLKLYNVLDIGCGNGRLLGAYLDYFGNKPESYVGVDLSHGLITEARKIYPDDLFFVGDMLSIHDVLEGQKYKNIFLIASFHHLQTLEVRQIMMKNLYDLLDLGGNVFMTNWALSSLFNNKKYASSLIAGSENSFGSTDYLIKFGDNDRYYHNFSLKELKYLSNEAGFDIKENRIFEGDRNIITILSK